VSIAVLCNASSGQATAYAHAVAEALMPGLFTPAPTPAPARPPVQPLRPGREELKALEGTFVSDEAETAFTLSLNGETLVLHRRPDTNIRLVSTATPDVFQASGLGSITFRRAPDGQVVALSVAQDRVFDLRFTKR
jgi:hypothetical protein